MIYSITGSNKKRRALLTRAVDRAVTRLKIPSNTILEIAVRRGRLEDNAYGYCEYEGKTNKKQYVHIELFGQIMDSELVSTLFHELKHAEQFTTGLLSADNTRYKGRDYSTSQAYLSLPWEVSARGFEERMLNRWIAEGGL